MEAELKKAESEVRIDEEDEEMQYKEDNVILEDVLKTRKEVVSLISSYSVFLSFQSITCLSCAACFSPKLFGSSHFIFFLTNINNNFLSNFSTL